MKTVLACCLLLFPLLGWAQPDTLRPVSPEALRPIGTEHFPTYGRYGGGYRTQFQYDGLDIKPTDLKPYIMASGDPDAIANFNRYLERRQTGKVLIWLGAITATTGLVMTAVARSDPNSSNPWVASNTVGDGPSGAGGFVVGMLGVAVATVGLGESMPTGNKHLRRAIQHYNRSLNRRGISWQLSPYGTVRSSGLALVGRF